MATVLDPNKDNKQNVQNNQNPTLGQGQTTSSVVGTGNQTVPSLNKAPASSGRFTNINKYIQANRGNQFAQDFGNKITQKADQTKQNINQAQQNFNTQAQQGRLATDQTKGVFAAGKDDLSNLNQDQQQIYGNVLTSSGYAGPKGLQNEQQVLGQAQRAQQIGQQAVNQKGRTALLSDFYAKPQYSQGARNLDNLLLSQDKSGAIQQAAAKTAALQGMASNAANLANTQAANYAGQDLSFLNNARNAFDTQAQNLNTNLSDAAKAETARRTSLQGDWTNQLASGNITDAELAGLFGLNGANSAQGKNFKSVNPSQAINLYGQSPTDLLNYNSNVGAEQVANDKQIAQFNALKNIMGNRYSSAATDSGIGNYDVSKLGKLNDFATLDSNKLNQAKTAYDTQYANTVKPLEDTFQQLGNKFNSLDEDTRNYARQISEKRARGEDIRGYSTIKPVRNPNYGYADPYLGTADQREFLYVTDRDANALADQYDQLNSAQRAMDSAKNNLSNSSKTLKYGK